MPDPGVAKVLQGVGTLVGLLEHNSEFGAKF